MATRDVVLKAVWDLVRYDPRREFAVHEVIRMIATSHPYLAANTVRACITDQLCTARGALAPVEKIGRGRYRLTAIHQRHS